MSGHDCSDVCEAVHERLNQLGFRFSDEEDQTGILEALNKVEFICASMKAGMPDVVIGYDVLHEYLEDKMKDLCIVLPDDMSMERAVKLFAEYCSSDVHDWLKDNLKSFFDKYDFPSKYDKEEEE
jgi:hypothetical protein